MLLRKILVMILNVIVVSSCSYSGNKVTEVTFDSKEMIETNKPFQTPYQSKKADTTMLFLDKQNDQVEIEPNLEYVFWDKTISKVSDIKQKDRIIKEINKGAPKRGATKNCIEQECVQSKKVIYKTEECTEKGC